MYLKDILPLIKFNHYTIIFHCCICSTNLYYCLLTTHHTRITHNPLAENIYLLISILRDVLTNAQKTYSNVSIYGKQSSDARSKRHILQTIKAKHFASHMVRMNVYCAQRRAPMIPFPPANRCKHIFHQFR